MAREAQLRATDPIVSKPTLLPHSFQVGGKGEERHAPCGLHASKYIDPMRFLPAGRKRRLNEALSVLYVIPVFFWTCFVGCSSLIASDKLERLVSGLTNKATIKARSLKHSLTPRAEDYFIAVVNLFPPFDGLPSQWRRSGSLGSWPPKIYSTGDSMFWPPPLKNWSHSFIQNCCWITLQVSSHIKDERLASKTEGKTNFSRHLQAVKNRNCWVFGNHWRRV